MKKLVENYEPKFIQALQDWENILIEAISLFAEQYEGKKIKCQNTETKNIISGEVKINDLKIAKIIQNVIDDIALISYRYKISNFSVKNRIEIDKYKVAGSFLYHFIKQLPLDSASINCNINASLTILSLIEDSNQNRIINLKKQVTLAEFKFFLENRLTTPENLYFILKNL